MMSATKKLIWIVLFGVAFALVEAAVVVYLRGFYYPEGFGFPIGRLPADILRTEIIREGATILILMSTAILAGRTWMARIGAYFALFGVWDIFYYVWLKVFLDWPERLLDWDVLFLIPGPWTAPVLAPLMVSVAFVGCGAWVFTREEGGDAVKVTVVDWVVEGIAAVIIITSFLSHHGESMPGTFAWWLFLTGLLGGTAYFLWRMSGSQQGRQK